MNLRKGKLKLYFSLHEGVFWERGLAPLYLNPPA